MYPKFKVRNKRQVLCFFILVIAGMFALRAYLLRSGRIVMPQVLAPAELEALISSYEVDIEAAGYHGSGTIIQFQEPGRKQEFGTCYIVSAAHLLEHLQQEKAVVSFYDGTSAECELIDIDTDLDIGILRCQVNGQDSVYYSEDLLYQMQEGDGVYYLSRDDRVMRGSFVSRDIDIPQIGDHRLVFQGESLEGMSGAGIYSATGHYLGMIAAGTDGQVACLPGNRVIRYFRENH